MTEHVEPNVNDCVRVTGAFADRHPGFHRVIEAARDGYVVVRPVEGGADVIIPQGWVERVIPKTDLPATCSACQRVVRAGLAGIVDHLDGCPRQKMDAFALEVARVRPAAKIGAPALPDRVDRVVRRTKTGDVADRERDRVEGLRVALRTLLGDLELDPETPARMARALVELTSGYDTDAPALLKKFPVEGDHGIVHVKGIPFASLCEHHVLPFTGTAAIAYIPKGSVVGLSKLPRLVRAYSRRLQMQERLGKQIADALWDAVDPLGVMVVLRGHHTCMSTRGVESTGEMVTSYVLGCFKVEPEARAEALALMG